MHRKVKLFCRNDERMSSLVEGIETDINIFLEGLKSSANPTVELYWDRIERMVTGHYIDHIIIAKVEYDE
jgi:hypothetical protein